jgi:CelD/BcsL family acetyltransferase involved in cellulose biosynthesis
MEPHAIPLLTAPPRLTAAGRTIIPRISSRDEAIKVSRISGGDLTEEQILAWSGIQRSNGQLDSPFFNPHFTRSVAAVRADVEVAILEQGREMVGFFPYQRTRCRIGNPVGGRLNDFQGLICCSELDLDLNQLLRDCGLLTWRFDHLIAAQAQFQACHWSRRRSLHIDVAERFGRSWSTQGFKSRRIRETLRKTRKFEREQGPIRFVPHETDPRAFQALLRWKSDQYRRTGAMDIFSVRWPIELLERVNQEPRVELCGQLSALYVGDRLAAVHQGLRSNHVLHSWFPAYDPSLAEMSPGMMLFVKLAREAESLGLERIDLGAGESVFKQSLASAATTVASGAVTRFAIHRGAQRGWSRAKSWLRTSPLRTPWRAAADRTRPLRDWFAMR